MSTENQPTAAQSGPHASEAVNEKAWLKHYSEWTSPEIDVDALFGPGANGDTTSTSRTLVDIFDNAVKEFADVPAFTFFGKSTTYKEYGALVDRAIAALRAAGVSKGDFVAIVAPNSPQTLIAFYATLCVGAVPALHNPLYTSSELKVPFNNHKARVGFFWEKANKVACELKKDTPLETVIDINLIDSMPRLQRFALSLPLPIPALKAAKAKLSAPTKSSMSFEDFLRQGKGKSTEKEKVNPRDPALILYTSGTTGTPKGALLNHMNLVSNLEQGREWVQDLGVGRTEKMMAALPIFHAYGLTMNITMAPAIGGTIQLLPAPEMDLILKLMKTDCPTWLPGVPTLYEKIMDTAEEKNVSLKGIRNSFSGASSLPVATVKRWEEMTGGNIVEGYGLTETSPIICGNPMGKGREGYIGVPFPSTEVRIGDPENPTLTMPDGEPGELMVRGPQVFSGYLDMTKATQEAFCDDWFLTGDMAVMESDGFIKIVSRIKEMIITGGFNIFPAEVEAVLREHDAVAHASVVGLDREDGSETVCAALVLAEGKKLDDSLKAELKEFCREKLTRYKVPRIYEQFDELPSDQLGKVRRGEVKELVAERLK